MNRCTAQCPAWLENRLLNAGGATSFRQYMDWVLNDPDHGAYGNGHLRIGKDGDFVTSASFGSDFAELLAIQLIDWFHQLNEQIKSGTLLSLVEVGPGEGDLAFELLNAIEKISPELIKKLQLILVETNEGMIARQKKRLEPFTNIPIHWCGLNNLVKDPVYGVMLAHEMLDALPVERLVWNNEQLWQQGVTLSKDEDQSTLNYINLPISNSLRESISHAHSDFGIEIPPSNAPDGWSTEWHCDLSNWFREASKALVCGPLLVIDYVLEARRFYNISRPDGTLFSYRNQTTSTNFLNQPGYWDITSHLCLETLLGYAKNSGFHHLGHARQGQALLALGLSERLYSLQKLLSNDLANALIRREALLRLVDPALLGEFRWLAFYLNQSSLTGKDRLELKCLFLEDPIL